MQPRTAVKDVVLANRNGDDSAAVVEAVEWAAIEDTGLAIRDTQQFPDFDAYLASYEVAL